MATNLECKLGTALSALVTAAILLVAGAGGTAVLAETTTLQGPISGLKTAPRNGLGVGNTSSPLTSPVAAPLTAPMGQTGLAPANATTQVRVGANALGTKKYLLKAQVVPGAILSATQKLTTAMAALAELAKQAKEQQDKETEDKIALLQKTLSIGNSATLSLLSPKSPIGNATLSVGMADRVDFERNHVQFSPGSLKKFGPLIGWPAAYCDFKVPEVGFYMVAFTVENYPNVGGTTTVTASIGSAGAWGPQSEAMATLNKGISVVAVVREFNKDENVISRITSDDIFGFSSCEISRIK